MSFNANTYRMNRHRKQALAHLEAAREIKRRVVANTAYYDWEPPRIAMFAKRARLQWSLYRSFRTIHRMRRIT